MANTQKTAVVTGASQGIGAELVKAFLQRGYSVVATSRNITKANPFPATANLALVDGDIGDPGTAAKIVDIAISCFGRIDALVNNAGIYRRGRHPLSFRSASSDRRGAARRWRSAHRPMVARGISRTVYGVADLPPGTPIELKLNFEVSA